MIQEVLNLQQNNGNKLKSSSIRSNPKLIDDRENYSKMNVLIEKSMSFNEPKNQQDCNNNQKNGNNKLFLYLFIYIYINIYIYKKLIY